MKTGPFLEEWLAESTLHYLVKTDMDGRYRYVNKAFSDRFSFLATSLIGVHVSEIVIASDVGTCTGTFADCFRAPDKTHAIRIRKPSKDGTLFWTQWECRASFDENGQPDGVWCIGYDITEMQQGLEKVRDSSLQTEKILASITDGFITVSQDFEIMRSNTAARRWFGGNTNTMEGKSVEEVFQISPDHIFSINLRKAFRNKVTVHFGFFHEPGQRHFDASVYYSGGYATVYLRDQTEEIKIQQKARSSEIILRALYNSSQEVALVLSNEFKVLFFNDMAAKSAAAIAGKTLQEDLYLYDLVDKYYWEYILPALLGALEGNVLEQEMTGQNIDGTPIWFDVKCFPVINPEGKILGVAISANDITEKKTYQERIEEQRRRLRNIAFTQSHEIRGPLASILGLIQLLEATRTDAEQSEILDYMKACATQLDEVVHKVVGSTHEIS